MLKFAGWLISDDAAEQWVQQHLNVLSEDDQSWWAIPSIRLKYFVGVRRAADANFPIQRGHLTTVDFPATTPEQFGTGVCVLVRHFGRRQAETWNNFTPIPPSEKDMAVAEFLAKDGLELGEWVTIPDPWQDEWPFSRRYPGRRPAPDPDNLYVDSDSD